MAVEEKTKFMYLDKNWQSLKCEQHGRVLTVTFDTGDRINSFDFTLMQELIELTQLLENDSELSAIILSGKEQIFTGGMNLKTVAKPEGVSLVAWRKIIQLGPKLCEAWERLEPITIAAIEGWCVGAGVALTSACDLRVLGEGSILYVPEIERGMNMSWGSVPRMVSLIGPARTKQFFALAEKVDARRALQWGLVDEVVAEGQALNKALELAERAAAMPPIPLRMCKQGINAAAQALSHAVGFMDTDQFMLCQKTEDYQEAISAFLEKRKPDYKGR